MADEDRQHTMVATIQAISRVLERLVTMAGWVLIVYFGGRFFFLSIQELAGQITFADIKIIAQGALSGSATPGGETAGNSSLIDRVSLWAGSGGVVVGVLGVLYGKFQARLRYSKTEYLENRISKLELSHDPNRSSSMLAPTGETRPEDKDD